MDTYIKESKEALEKMLRRPDETAKELVDLYLAQEYRKIKIIASGSSYHAALCARYYMEEMLQAEVEVETPFSFVHYGQCETAFHFVISQSGRSTNAIEALDRLRKEGKAAIGITGDTKSVYREHCDHILDYGVGEETVGYVTKGVVTLTLYLDLFALGAALRQNRITCKAREAQLLKLRDITACYPEVYAQAQAFIDENFRLLTSMHQAYVLGNHTAYGIAAEAALKIGETICIPASAHESEEFLHGPNLQLTPTYTVFVIDAHDATSARSRQIYEAVSAVCERCFYIGLEEPHADSGQVDAAGEGAQECDRRKLLIAQEVDHNLLPFVYLQVFQLISYRVTESLHRWEKHPTLRWFREKIRYKAAEEPSINETQA